MFETYRMLGADREAELLRAVEYRTLRRDRARWRLDFAPVMSVRSAVQHGASFMRLRAQRETR